MSIEQKRAWMGVISMAVCVVAYLSLIPFIGPLIALSVFGLFGLNMFSVFFREKEKPDERDKAIIRRATGLGFAASYSAFVLCYIGIWAVVYKIQGDESVSVHVLGMTTMFGFFAFYFTRCVAILVLYGRAVEADDLSDSSHTGDMQ